MSKFDELFATFDQVEEQEKMQDLIDSPIQVSIRSDLLYKLFNMIIEYPEKTSVERVFKTLVGKRNITEEKDLDEVLCPPKIEEDLPSLKDAEEEEEEEEKPSQEELNKITNTENVS